MLAQYYGYLRRNPDDAPDNNFSGYDFWLNKLEQFSLPGEDVRDEVVAFSRVQRAEMVRSFLISIEYRERFGGRPSGNQQSKSDESPPVAASKPQEFGSVWRQAALQFFAFGDFVLIRELFGTPKKQILQLKSATAHIVLAAAAPLPS